MCVVEQGWYKQFTYDVDTCVALLENPSVRSARTYAVRTVRCQTIECEKNLKYYMLIQAYIFI